MFVVLNRFFVKPTFAQQFENRIRNRPGQVDHQPGILQVQLLRPTTPTEPFVVVTMWQSEAHFESWRTDQNFKEGHKGKKSLGPDIFWQPNKLETFTVVLDNY